MDNCKVAECLEDRLVCGRHSSKHTARGCRNDGGVQGAMAPWNSEKLLVIDQPNRFVVGAKICSHWDAGTGGWWKLKGGGLLQHRLSVEVETQESRGCHWSLCVYSVDNELYKRI